MPDATAALARLSEVARTPRRYVDQWRADHPGRQVVGVLPMNFPREIAHAAGTLPVVVQDDQVPVTEGRSLLAEFYCGYTRNLADQAATGRFDSYDAIFMADHCIQLIGAADVVRALLPDTPVFFGMLNSSMNDSWAPRRVAEMMAEFRTEFAAFTGHQVDDADLRSSIEAHNRDRRLIRSLFDERSTGGATFTPGQLQDVVTSSMVMDPVEHHALLRDAASASRAVPRDDRVRVHLSGHLCHAPKRELLEAIEDSGAIVVDDDLFHGRRYVSTDVDETGDPLDALARWYSQRNVTIPCPTRVQQDADWDVYLVDAVRRSGAEAVIHLLPKFCEPHMLYYPELRKGLDAAGIPQLQLETEHEGMPLESFRTRIEALVERTLRKRPVPA
ncbi:MAG TPA: 2-hydroxyacyl-CoA dehydratase family protein [Kribbella sp.]|jgi:bcr-type benzoyl-CoA reductase subunit C